MRYIPRQFSTVIPQVPYHRTLANSRFDPGKTGIPGTPLKGHYRSTNSIPTFATSRTVYRPSMMTSQTIINVDLRPMDAPSGNRISERKLTREELRTLADRFLLYINTDNADPEELAKMVANDVATPLFYPGMRSGWAGLSDILAKLHGALTDYSMQLVTPIVDEEGQIVVFFVQSVGVQTGYRPRMGRMLMTGQ